MSNIIFKKTTCTDKYGDHKEITYRIIPLYVVLTHNCNAHCEFCEFTKGKIDIDVNKFYETLKKLYSICKISIVHLTGGEPTTEINKIKEILKIIKDSDDFTTTSINTNGYNLKLLESISEIDNISLSRHAIDDESNYEIFGCKNIPSREEIKQFKDKQKLHLSCNLIKGYIDNNDKMLNYLEFASELGINDVGFVSLMNVNEYCTQHHVDFSDTICSTTDRIIKSNCYKNNSTGELICKCENYLYRAKNGMLLSAYHRYAIKNQKIKDYLVYENGILKQGFNGNIINLN